MSDVRVRLAGAGDVDALAGLIAGFRDHLGDTSPNDGLLRSQLPGALADPGLEFACAWLGDRPVGYTQSRFLSSVWVQGCEAFLEDLFVVADARRRDVGRRLLRHALSRARDRGASRMSLTTNEGNTPAQAFYRAEGLAPRAHRRFPGGREILWGVSLGPGA